MKTLLFTPALRQKWVWLFLFAIALTAGGSARADMILKAATGTDLANGASWNGVVPSAADIAVWNSTSLGAGLTLMSVVSWGGISVTGALSDIDISGNWGLIELNGCGIDLSASEVNLSLEVPIILNTNQTWNVNAGESLNVSGQIIGSWNLVKNGPGTLVLSDYNPILGLTTVNAGTLAISGQIHYDEGWQHLPALTINSGATVIVSSGNANNFLGECNFEATNNLIDGGVLEFDTASGTAEALERAFAVGANGATIEVLNTNATLIFDYFSDPMQFSVPAPASLTLSGNGLGIMSKTITGYGGLIKSGGGTWTLNGTNTFAGPTLVSNGTLVANAALWNSSITVADGATLGGAAIIPGNITFLPGAQAQFTLGAIASWTGTLTLNNNLVHLVLTTAVSPGNYLLATGFSMGGAGTFNSNPVIDSGSLAAGCTARIETDHGNVTLVVLPPPAPHLAIISVNGGANPSAGLPFSVLIQAQDTNGNPWIVAEDTTVVLSLDAGYGSLGGNLSGAIPAGSSSAIIAGAIYTLDEGAVVITATDQSGVLQPGISAPFTVNLGPPTTITLLSDTNCTGAPGMALPNPIMVQVADPGGNAVTGAGVTFAVTAAPMGATGQSLTVTNTTTGTDGIASSILTLGHQLGCYTVAVSLSGQNTNQMIITATAANNKWTQVWSDEFNYNGLPDSNKWNYEIGFVRNGESEYYTSNRIQNVSVTNGMLAITARKEQYVPPGQLYPVSSYTSASMITLGKESWTYGRMEARAKMPLPYGGVWTAFWAQGTNFPVVGWPVCGELDISEYVCWDPNPHGNAFWGYNGGTVGYGEIYLTPTPSYDDFHVYAAEWNTEKVDFYYDNTNYYTLYLDLADVGTTNAFRNPFYLIVNFALGGAWAGTIYDPGLPQSFLIDYVRVYQQLPTWIGAGTNDLWSCPDNWTNSVPLENEANVVFAAGTVTNSLVDTTYSEAGLTFYEMAGCDVISATNGGALVLTTNGISNYSTNQQTLNVPIILTANETFDTDPGGLNVGAVISGNGVGVNKTGPGTLTLCATNTYTGSTTIEAGTLALGAGACLITSSLNLAAGAALDVCACGDYTFGSGAALGASGSGLTLGTSAACLMGGVTNLISLPACPIHLVYDGSDPSLYVLQGVLALQGNAFTVNTANGQALAPGTYPIIVQATGNIRVTGAFPAVGGTAIGTGQTGLIVVSNNIVNLVITSASSLSLSVAVAQGNRTIQLNFTGLDSSVQYRIQASSDLAGTNWITLFTNMTGTGSLAAIIDADATNRPQRFYRVVTP
jgi:autotransporter-associated beta strand protein